MKSKATPNRGPLARFWALPLNLCLFPLSDRKGRSQQTDTALDLNQKAEKGICSVFLLFAEDHTRKKLPKKKLPTSGFVVSL